ncbi:MAG TPA: hypothetical protein VHC97_16785 [Thermoanaerobaculia bacterium]|nr:hypothetical protein [Thermoanaerobaculia bacterium]
MPAPRLLAPLFLALTLAAPALHAARGGNNKLVRVPQDAKTLAAAISQVADGGVIEMAAGTYPSPGANGFLINNAKKGFTVRAAAGAAVAIDGGGARALLRFANSDRARGKQVVFERITFQNGFSAETGKSGGVTLSKSDALFRSCVFLNNRAGAPQTGGGAVKALEGSTASFVNTSFRGNSSQLRGGAMVVRSAVVSLQGGDFTGNRTNLPGHSPNSFGGAIVVIDGTLRVSGVRFEGNQTGWVGGAIYAIGNWNKGSDVVVTRSSFLNNQAVRDLCCGGTDATTGGALHAEDLTTMRVHQSLFQGNRAEMGGAVDGYRAVVEIYGSVFQGNQTNAGRLVGGVGGAIALLSADHADSSTGFGAVNRQAGRLVVAQSLLQGGSGIERAAVSGGCILAGGDGVRQYGDGGIPQAGTLAENRAQVEIRGTVFSDCDVEAAPDGTGGSGGALVGDLIDLVMEDSMVLDSDARGANGVGGGVALRQESNARITHTAFARDSAQKFGGALFLSGSAAQVFDVRFYGNNTAPWVPGDARGAAIFSMPLTNNPARQRNVSGLISNSAFSENAGIPLWELDPPSGPINDLRYSADRFNPAGFDDRVYVNTLAAPNGLSTAGLNGLTVFRAGRPSTPKTEVPNAYLPGLREGLLVTVPSPNSVGAAPAAPTASLLAYAWTGGSAVIGAAGAAPLQKAGLLEVPPGDYTLVIDGAPVVASKALGSCTSGPFLCLAGNRFRAEVTWKPGTASLPAQAVAVSSGAGYFWFVDPAIADLSVEVVDNRARNGAFGVSFNGPTDVEFTLTVTDTVTGAVKTYVHRVGAAANVSDPTAFPAPRRRKASFPGG